MTRDELLRTSAWEARRSLNKGRARGDGKKETRGDTPLYHGKNVAKKKIICYVSFTFDQFFFNKRRKKKKKLTQDRLQNSPYFGVFKYPRSIYAINRSIDREQQNKRSRTRLKTESKTGGRRARKTLSDFFTDFEKKTDYFAVYTQERHTYTLYCYLSKGAFQEQ